jgi:hypothetical protein
MAMSAIRIVRSDAAAEAVAPMLVSAPNFTKGYRRGAT